MNYPEVTLGELADSKGSFVDGPFGSNLKASEYVDAGVPVMRLQNIRPNEYLPKDVKYITQKKADSLSRHNYKPGDVVIAKLGSVGTACIVPDYCGEGIIVADVVRFRGDKTRIYYQYLCDFLNSPEGQNRVLMLSKGTTRLRTNLTDLKTIEIPLPPLNDQKRIVYVLGKVGGAIAQRKQHLQQLDDLLKSVFLEMFGDPISNPKEFPIRKLSEFYINPKEGTKCGPFGSALKKDELVESGIPVWNMDNIDHSGRMVLPFRMWITEEKYQQLSSYSVQDGDIIISRAGTVGKMCVAHMDGSPAIISSNLIRLRLGSNLRPLYTVSLMIYCKGRVGRLKTGADGAFTHMNTGILDQLEFPYPPVELQDKFLSIVEKVESVKFCYQESLTDLENLYGALSQKAFKGELDLSRVPLPSEDTDATAAEPAEVRESPLPTETFNLPAPPDLTTLNSAEGRYALINQWLTAWLTHMQDTPFSPQSFIEASQQRLVELAEEEDLPEWSIAEYNSVQAWVFEALGDRRLTQTYDDDKNRVQLHAVNSR